MTPLLFQQLILDWFDRHGRKHFPWQQDKTPYRVWVSEIMLQQTQVTTVVPYFIKFMQEFPQLPALAHAREDRVLHHWSGLGYYSRARNLHKAAKKIMQERQGHFPEQMEDILSLPGIGRSTAGAIVSIAYGRPAAILDGNVKRVLARFLGTTKPVNEKNTEASLWAFANAHVSEARPGDYTQAMMDLGSTVCTRTKPACPACPLVGHCAAFAQNTVHLLPMKKTARPLPKRSATFLLLRHEKRGLLLQKRPPTGIWGGLWSFPELPGEPDMGAIRKYCRQRLGLSIKKYQLLPPLPHAFTHYHLTIFPVLIVPNALPPGIAEADQSCWYAPCKPAAIGLPKPIQQLITDVFNLSST